MPSPGNRRASLVLAPLILLLLLAGVAALFLDVGDDEGDSAAGPGSQETTPTSAAVDLPTAAPTTAPTTSPVPAGAATTTAPATTRLSSTTSTVPVTTSTTAASTTTTRAGTAVGPTPTTASTTSTTAGAADAEEPAPGPVTRTHPATGRRLPAWPAAALLVLGLLGLRHRRQQAAA